MLEVKPFTFKKMAIFFYFNQVKFSIISFPIASELLAEIWRRRVPCPRWSFRRSRNWYYSSWQLTVDSWQLNNRNQIIDAVRVSALFIPVIYVLADVAVAIL